MERIYGTCVAVDGRAVLLRGPSRSGKSDLALRVIDAGGRLVADDQTVLFREGDRLVATSPAAISGQLEVRGFGIMPVAAVDRAPLSLVVDLVPAEQVERMPEARTCAYLGLEIPLFNVAAFEGSAAAKLRLALQHLAGR